MKIYFLLTLLWPVSCLESTFLTNKPLVSLYKLCVFVKFNKGENYIIIIYIDIYLDHLVPTELEPAILGNNVTNARRDGFPMKPTNSLLVKLGLLVDAPYPNSKSILVSTMEIAKPRRSSRQVRIKSPTTSSLGNTGENQQILTRFSDDEPRTKGF